MHLLYFLGYTMSRHRIDPALLLLWTRVARAGNLHAAAEELFLTQPAISHRLKQLQERVGEPVYRRARHGIVPTPIGLRLAMMGEKIELVLEEVEQLCQSSEGLLHGSIRILASNSIAELLLPGALARFRNAYPGIHLQLTTSNSRQARLHRDEADLVFVEDDLPEPREARWVQERLLSTRIVLLVPAQHPLASTPEPIHLRTLRDSTLIWRESGSGIREAVLQAFREIGVFPEIRFELNGLAAIRDGVRAELGLAFVSATRGSEPSSGLVTRELSPMIPHRLSVLYRDPLDRASETLLQHIREAISALTGGE